MREALEQRIVIMARHSAEAKQNAEQQSEIDSRQREAERLRR